MTVDVGGCPSLSEFVREFAEAFAAGNYRAAAYWFHQAEVAVDLKQNMVRVH